MPAIRDFAYSLQTSTAGTTFESPLPYFEAGDLLLILIAKDSTATTFTSTGAWGNYTALTMGTQAAVSLGVLWRIADGTETDPTVTASAGDTWVQVIMSIKDVHASAPIHKQTDTSFTGAQNQAVGSVTPTVNNCLILYVNATDTAKIPRVLGGNTVNVLSIDGTAESLGCGYSFQNTAGATAVDRYYHLSAAEDQVTVALAIAPPAGGAAFRPAMPTLNGLTLLDSLNGVTATTMLGAGGVNTLNTTLFGTAGVLTPILSSFLTLQVAGAAAADASILPFRGSYQEPHSVNSPRKYSGSGITLQTAVNLTDKALLLHVNPSTPKEITDLAFYHQLGVAALMMDTTGNLKAWKIRGQGDIWGFDNHVPCLMHPDANDTLLDIQSLFDATRCYGYNGNTAAYTDESTDMNSVTTGDVSLPPYQITSNNDAFYWGNSVPFNKITINISTPGTYTAGTLAWQYWNGAWTAVTVVDGTGGFKNAAAAYNVTWTAPSDWVTNDPGMGQTAYWIRAIFTTKPTAFTTTLVTSGTMTEATGANAALVKTAINRIGVLGSPLFKAGGSTSIVNYSMMWSVGQTGFSGGTAANPITFSDIIGAFMGIEAKLLLKTGANEYYCSLPLQIGDGTNLTVFVVDSAALEFPALAAASRKNLHFHAPANWAGLIYYASSSDTIQHTNSIISSASRYKWGFHASSSVPATYSFSGLQVIGAGTITLNKAVTITNLTINDYSTLDVSGATLTGCIIKTMPATDDSITTSNTTVIQTSTITTTTVTAGNRWCSVAIADLDIFASNTFTGSHTSGHAIRISPGAGSNTIVGNTFTSFGPTVFGFHTTDDITEGDSDWITKADHGYNNGDPIRYMKQGGTAVTGLSNDTTYYVRAVTTSTLAFYTSSANAIADTSRISLTKAGAETHYINSLGAAIYNDSGGAITLTISGGGSTPTIRNGANASTTVSNPIVLTIRIVDADGDLITADCEVTVVKVSDESVLFTEDDIVDGITAYSFSSGAGTAVYINVHNVAGFQNRTAYLDLPASNTTTSIQLDEDRFFSNPT